MDGGFFFCSNDNNIWGIGDSTYMAAARAQSLEFLFSSMVEGFMGRERREVLRTGWLCRVRRRRDRGCRDWWDSR